MVRRSPGSPLLIGLLVSLGVAAIALAQAGPRSRLETLNVRETVLTTEQGNNLNRLARLLTVLEQFRRDPPPALLVSPEDATDAVRAAILVKAIAPELQRRAKIYAVEASEIARQRRLAAVASEALFTNDSEAADQHAESGEEIVNGVNEPLARLPPAAERDVTAPASLLRPAEGPLLHRFGDRLTGGGRSNGVTLRTEGGTAVQAPGDGTVQYVGPVKGWGVILILRLSGGYHLVLAGMDRAQVNVGQSVAAGAPVGWMPDGKQSPSELYLEIRERGVPVDPGRWLKAKAG
jgi:septal ring factor EnvC (AmiA/AmiB activator)